MSVPVRYTAAANNNIFINNISNNSDPNAQIFVVDSGLSVQQEQQYHFQQYQQQQQLLLQQQYQALVEQQQQQQQLMQQRSSMSSSSLSSSSSSLSGMMPATDPNVTIATNTNTTINPIDYNMLEEQPATTSYAAVAAAAALLSSATSSSSPSSEVEEEDSAIEMNGGGSNNNIMSNNDNNAEMRTEWMSDEGRYGTPGAAGLEYQKYELEQQHQQQQQTQQLTEDNAILNNGDNNRNPMETSSMDTGNNGNSNSNINMNMNSLNHNPSSSKSKSSSSGKNKSSNNPTDNTNKYNTQNVEAELHAMTAQQHYDNLKEYDILQEKYHTVLCLPKEDKREVTAGGRDGSAYVLRCLKMWYELPSDVLFAAMSLVDRFLDRMAVKPKHMACMSVASLFLAIKQLGLKTIPAEDLVTISQCGCTAGDLERMARVIATKLSVYKNQTPITAVNFLRCYYALFRIVAKDVGEPFFTFYQNFIKLEEMENRLEILLCDVRTTAVQPMVLALVLISLHLDFHIKESYTRGRPELKTIFEYILFLQQYMRIPDRVFTSGFSLVSGILSHYNGQNKQPYKQRLVWKLSSRTLRQLRPTNRFSSVLPTIEEGISNAMDDGCRSRTESISSEEEEDWPTSPIIPIFEQC